MPPRSGLTKGLIALARWICAGILLYAAGRQISAELSKLQVTELRIHPVLLLIGAALYVVALACFGAYWRQAVLGMGGSPGRVEALRAYCVSQLGKYIPGKAWVLLIRCALIDTRTTIPPVIIASTIYETLAMMAAGSLVALVALLSVGDARPGMLALSGALAVGLFFAVLPPVFGRLVTWASRWFRKEGTNLIAAVSYPTWLNGFRYCVPGWIAAGLSLLAVAGSLDISLFSFVGFLLACGSMALAVVGGFAVLIVPAGLGVREWVLMQTLGPSVGASNAVLIAILVRITHVSVELLVAVCLYLVGKRNKPND